MILTLAWRNIWRNRNRTFLLIISIVLGLLALLVAMAFMNGLSKSLVDNAINTQYSHIQIHHPDYSLDYNPSLVVRNKETLLSRLDTMKSIAHYTWRAKIDGLASTQKSSRGVTVLGIDPMRESEVTEINSFITEGAYFTDAQKRPIILGKKLAEKLGVKLKSKVLITYFNASNELTAESFRVSAILETNSALINGGCVFIPLEQFYTFYGKENVVHEVAIKLHNIEDAPMVAQLLKKVDDKNVIETWREIAPELETSINENRMEKTMVLVVIILAFSFGLINTMLMQISERVREIGMLIANGMSRLKVSMMIIVESVFSVTLASILGLLIGALVISYFGHYGMDFSRLAQGFESQGWSKVVYPVLYAEDYIKVFICSCISGLLGAVIPAYRAVRLNVVSIVRR